MYEYQGEKYHVNSPVQDGTMHNIITPRALNVFFCLYMVKGKSLRRSYIGCFARMTCAPLSKEPLPIATHTETKPDQVELPKEHAPR